MKRLFAMLVMLATLTIATSAMAQMEWIIMQILQNQPPAYDYNLDKVASQLNTPQKVSNYMATNFTYDNNKTYQTNFVGETAAQVNSTKIGICADFAAFSSTVLAWAGLDVFEVAYQTNPNGNGHAVTYVNNYNGSDWVLSNTRLYQFSENANSDMAATLKKVDNPAIVDHITYYGVGQMTSGYKK